MVRLDPLSLIGYGALTCPGGGSMRQKTFPGWNLPVDRSFDARCDAGIPRLAGRCWERETVNGWYA